MLRKSKPKRREKENVVGSIRVLQRQTRQSQLRENVVGSAIARKKQVR